MNSQTDENKGEISHDGKTNKSAKLGEGWIGKNRAKYKGK